MIPFLTSAAEYPGLYTPVNTLALGIPTHAMLDGVLDDAVIDDIEDFTYHNIYMNNAVNGKVRPNIGDSIRTLDEMTYWALQGQDRAWWGTDLKLVQEEYSNRQIANGCTASATLDATFQLSACSSAMPSLDYP